MWKLCVTAMPWTTLCQYNPMSHVMLTDGAIQLGLKFKGCCIHFPNHQSKRNVLIWLSAATKRVYHTLEKKSWFRMYKHFPSQSFTSQSAHILRNNHSDWKALVTEWERGSRTESMLSLLYDEPASSWYSSNITPCNPYIKGPISQYFLFLVCTLELSQT